MEIIHKTVDARLSQMIEEDYPLMTIENIPADMRDTTADASGDSHAWKPTDSTITDDDLNKFETAIKLNLPASYRAFLQYKHFAELELEDLCVTLPTFLPDKELGFLREMVFDMWEPDLLLGKGYIYFADFEDFGFLCFDTNQKSEGHEYPIVFIDHETPETAHFYAENFTELLTSDEEAGNRFIEKLNAYYE